MAKWRLVISGRVQGAGYRALVKSIAKSLGVKGTVKNLDDGTVEVLCEADQATFDRFKKAVNVKGDPNNTFAPLVKNVGVFKEGTNGYGKKRLAKDFKTFSVDYGTSRMRDAEKESLERSEIAIHVLLGLRSDMASMNNGMNKMNNSMTSMNNNQTTGTQKTHEKLDSIADASIKTHDRLDSIDNRLGDALGRYDKIGKKMTDMETNLSELTKQITRLVDHVVDEKK
jgi:acylphosphatase